MYYGISRRRLRSAQDEEASRRRLLRIPATGISDAQIGILGVDGRRFPFSGEATSSAYDPDLRPPILRVTEYQDDHRAHHSADQPVRPHA